MAPTTRSTKRKLKRGQKVYVGVQKRRGTPKLKRAKAGGVAPKPPKEYCIYINVVTEEVTKQEVTLGNLEAYYALVGDPVELGMRLPNGDIVYVDGDGEYREPRAARFALGQNCFVGSAIVVGLDECDGSDVCPTSTVESVKRMVQFLTA